MRHLVTGGCGLIGTNLISYLIKNNNEIICIDNLSSGSLENVKKWMKHPNFLFLKKDVLDELDLKVNYIWHFASPTSPLEYMKKPIEAANIAFNGTLNMLNLAKKNNAKMLFASSSEIYGDPEINAQDEKYNGNVSPLSKRACYSEGKRIAETLCYEFKRNFNLDIKVARIFNTYGPGMSLNDKRVISSFILSCIKEKPLIIYGDGNVKRTFCYIDDLIEGLLKLMDSNINYPVNLGSCNAISIKDLADLIIAKFNNHVDIIYLNQLPDDPQFRKPEIELAKEKLSWYPKTTLDIGISKTMDYFRKLKPL